jgi:hypothetical protein
MHSHAYLMCINARDSRHNTLQGANLFGPIQHHNLHRNTCEQFARTVHRSHKKNSRTQCNMMRRHFHGTNLPILYGVYMSEHGCPTCAAQCYAARRVHHYPFENHHADSPFGPAVWDKYSQLFMLRLSPSPPILTLRDHAVGSSIMVVPDKVSCLGQSELEATASPPVAHS